jgi:hypothetical protein
MTDATKYTTNRSFQKIGDAQELEVADYNSMLDALDKTVGEVGNVAADFTVPAGVTVSKVQGPKNGTQYLRLTLAALVVSATNANKYGGTEILNWPNANLFVDAARMNLIATKDGAQIQAADTPTVAVGSVTASNTTLSSTMIDTIGIVTLAGTAAPACQKNGPATPAARAVAAGATNKLFLNIGATGNTGGGTGNISFAGTVDVYFRNTGTYGA